MRHRLSFESQSATQDAIGQLENTWTEIVTRVGSVEPINGRELLAASGEHADVDVRIRTRYDAALRPVVPYDRVVDYTRSPGVVYDIRSVVNVDERNRELVFMCRRNG